MPRRPTPSIQASRCRNLRRATIATGPRSCSALARIASGLSALVARGIWALIKGGLYVASRYPRHSLAAGASILILGAVLYTQLRSGNGCDPQGWHPPVTARIPGDAATLVAESGTNAAPAKKNEVE